MFPSGPVQAECNRVGLGRGHKMYHFRVRSRLRQKITVQGAKNLALQESSQKYCLYKLRIIDDLCEVQQELMEHVVGTSRSQTYIKHVTMVLNLKFSVQLIVSLLTLLIVKLGGDI